ncbi:MAG: ABC transporter permease [Chloroflexota bacterium]
MPLYLAYKEMWRNKARFTAIILIVALTTLLVIFLAALSDGLALSAKQYIENIDAELIVFQNDVDLQIPASRLGRSRINDLERIAGVEAIGAIGVSSAAVMLPGPEGLEKINVTLVGVDPGMPGSPSTVMGRELADERAEEVVIDQHLLNRADVDIPLGSTLTLKVIQGTEERLFDLTVVGHASGQFINFGPSIFVPLRVWNSVKPQDRPGGGSDLIFNMAAVQVDESANSDQTAALIQEQVNRIEVTDRVSTYEATAGFLEMQQLIVVQQNFVLLIVLLIIGGFFQIQALQKVTQIGMLKAIGAPNRLITLSLLTQVMLTTAIGLLIGGGTIYLLSFFMPPSVPIVFDVQKIGTAVISILISGPLAAIVAVRTLFKVEPLKALGLS